MDVLFALLMMGSLVALVAGLIVPSFFTQIFKSWATRGKLAMIFFGSFLGFGMIFDAVSPDTPEAPAPAVVQEQVVQRNEELTPAVTVPEAQVEAPQQPELYEVVSVTDGDTLKVNISGKTETLRLIGMDTPETVDPRTPVQCFGKEASNKAKEILTGKKVRLESDATQGELDKYNRLLRYLYLEDGTSYNKLMVAEGYAHEYTYNTPYKYQAEYKEAEKNARENKKGFWGDVCGGDTTQPAEKPKVTPAPAPKEEATSGAGWACNCAKTCANMSCSEAQYQLNSCGCSRRDGDGDGVACDSQCGG